ncbi:MAG: HAD hydrolase-like protein [Oscillospiraceae bacterium]|nr:HAD hydrolase-like protein [Oscillospiraceae bacterium]
MIRTVLFDLDGTLFDTVEGITKSVRYALRKRGMDAPLEELRCFAGPPLIEKFMEVYGFSRAEAEQATRDFRERYVPVGLYESRPFPQIRPFLEALTDAGAILAVTTSKPRALAEELLEREGLRQFFACVSGASDEGKDDAKWQVIRSAMETLGAREEETVLVGDTKYDVAGASRCSIGCIGVAYGYAAPGELESAGASPIVQDLDELLEVLLEMSR